MSRGAAFGAALPAAALLAAALAGCSLSVKRGDNGPSDTEMAAACAAHPTAAGDGWHFTAADVNRVPAGLVPGVQAGTLVIECHYQADADAAASGDLAPAPLPSCPPGQEPVVGQVPNERVFAATPDGRFVEEARLPVDGAPDCLPA